MNKKERIKTLKQAQAIPPVPTATPVPTTAPKIDLRSAPNFKADLFSAKPDIIDDDLSGIVNIINKYLFLLSAGKIAFDMVWRNPSITGSEYTNSSKNLFNLAKWIYNVVKAQASGPYSLEGLKQIANSLITTVNGYSFPEPEAKNVKSELVTAGTKLLNKLGQNK